MENNLVSIIVPIYNVEKYLKQCIDSIINQSYKNIEIILVDDGSPDKCPEMCDEYKNIDNRIKVIHKENGGLSDARNKGIEVAKGRYITFVDSDDYINEDFIKKLVESILKNKADISMCAVQKFDIKSNYVETVPISNKSCMNGKEVIKEIKKFPISNVIACSKLYKIELFDNIRFPKNKINEDEFTTYKILYKSKKISIIQDALYYYRYNENSITNKKFSNKRLDIIEAMEERMKIFEEKKELELYENTLNIYLGTLMHLYYIGIKEMERETKQLIIKKYREVYIKAKERKCIDKNKKVLRKVFYIMPNLYIKFKKIL